MTRARTWIAAAVLAAFALRLAFALAQDPTQPFDITLGSGDSGWYLANAYALVTGAQSPYLTVAVSGLTQPPVYFLVIGIPQALLTPSAAALIVIRIAQVAMSAAICWLAAGIARRMSGERAALLAAWALAVHPALIVEASLILTETTFIFLLTAAVYVFVSSERRRWLSAVLFGAATLTRAVLLPFPFAFGVVALLRRGLSGRGLLAFALVYALVVSTWTIYNLVRWDRFVIAGEGFAAFLYLGATGWDGPREVDQRLQQQGAMTGDTRNFGGAAASSIAADPFGYAQRRLTELAAAYLQPHGTTFFPGASIRDALAAWWRDDRTPAGLLAMTQIDSFWSKLSLYMIHYAGLAFGALGIIRCLRQRESRAVALLLLTVIGYFTLVHLALLALPRYLFPTMICWWIFAASSGLSNHVHPRH
jgi:4-amino-4-deoxy-L-arabinose transferase-like glycosyltransferase